MEVDPKSLARALKDPFGPGVVVTPYDPKNPFYKRIIGGFSNPKPTLPELKKVE